MGEKVLFRFFLVLFQSSVENGLKIGRGGRCGCRWSVRHHSKIGSVRWRSEREEKEVGAEGNSECPFYNRLVFVAPSLSNPPLPENSLKLAARINIISDAYGAPGPLTRRDLDIVALSFSRARRLVTSFIMESSTVWLHLVDHKFQTLGHCFKFETTSHHKIYHFKDRVKTRIKTENLKPEIFSCYNIDTLCHGLTLWKMEGEIVLNRSTAESQEEEIIEKVNINDRGTIQKLDEDVLVAELQLPDCQILLLQLPGMSYFHQCSCVSSDILNKDLSLLSKFLLILVDHKFQAIGQPFQVETSYDNEICDLKNKVKELKPDIFSFHYLDSSCLTMWKMEGKLVLNRSTAKPLVEILKKIDVDDKEMLDEHIKVAELQPSLADGQILLAQLPGMSCF